MCMLLRMLQVDDFDLNVDSPSAAGAASPDVAPQPAVEAADLAAKVATAHHTDSNSSTAGEDRRDAASAYTAEWLQAIPSPDAQLGKDASRLKPNPTTDTTTAENSPADTVDSSQEKAPTAGQSLQGACSEAGMAAEGPLPAAAADITERRLTLTAPVDEASDGETLQDLHVFMSTPVPPSGADVTVFACHSSIKGFSQKGRGGQCLSLYSWYTSYRLLSIATLCPFSDDSTERR